MIIGTAGHIDHGKTALVKALTGVETDRLPEERRRGITIALGFAPLELPEIGTAGIIDVPGHEAFVRTMLAGAMGIDCALLVVAADEGVMPQTREHLHIIQLLGIPRAVVALTKADAADADLQTLVTLDVGELLAESPYRSAPIVPVSAHTGEGLDTLRAALQETLASLPPRDDGPSWRLPIDRVFSVAGAGTVVTGTATMGGIAVGDTVRILPGERSARIRSLESHGRSVERNPLGVRLAVALVGVDKQDIRPGDVLARTDDAWHPSQVLRADITLLADAAPITPRTRLRFHLGTAECGARIVSAEGPVHPGGVTAVRVALDSPIAAAGGDRFVLRGGSPHTTLGGGVVTDPWPLSPRARPWPHAGAEPAERVQWMLHEAGALGINLATLPIRLGLSSARVEQVLKRAKDIVRVGDRLVASSVLDAMRHTLIDAVERTHRETPLAQGLDRQTARALLSPHLALADEVIRRAERARVVEVAGSALRRPGWDPSHSAGTGDRIDTLRARLEQAGAEPPTVAELQAEFGADVPALLKLLDREGAAIAIARDRWFATAAVSALLTTLANGTTPTQRYTPSEVRELLGISRKYLIPFLEWCDAKGISHRRDDGRLFPSLPYDIQADRPAGTDTRSAETA